MKFDEYRRDLWQDRANKRLAKEPSSLFGAMFKKFWPFITIAIIVNVALIWVVVWGIVQIAK